MFPPRVSRIERRGSRPQAARTQAFMPSFRRFGRVTDRRGWRAAPHAHPMLAKLKALDSPDTLDGTPGSFHADDPERFSLSVTASIGPADGEGQELFQVEVCSPAALRGARRPHGYTFVRHVLLVERWDAELVENRASGRLCQTTLRRVVGRSRRAAGSLGTGGSLRAEPHDAVARPTLRWCKRRSHPPNCTTPSAACRRTTRPGNRVGHIPVDSVNPPLMRRVMEGVVVRPVSALVVHAGRLPPPPRVRRARESCSATTI